MKTVLFADDELHFIQGLLETVRAEGYNVLTCRNASKAIELTTTQTIDCLIIDIMMDPGKDLQNENPQFAGLIAIDKILKLQPRQSIVCYSVVSDPDIIHGLKKRGVLYLRKAETSAEVAWRIIESKATGLLRA